MNPIRVMAKLTEQTPKFDGVGGINEYDIATCAALCRGIPRPAYLAARLKWCLDWSVANELEYLLWVEAAGLAAKERWRVPKGKEYVRRMSGLAIAETADPKHWITQTSRAEFMGIGVSEWSRVWRERYEGVYGLLSDWTDDAYRTIQRAQIVLD